jgi:hypothetical protein
MVVKGGLMHKRIFLLCSCALLFLQLTAVGQSLIKGGGTVEDLPPFVLSGLQAYKDKGPDEAVRLWIKDSPIDGSKEALSQANTLRQIQDFYGGYQFFEVISAYEIGHRTRIFYLTLNFEKGPLFAKFVVYQSNHRWILTSFDFNTKEEMILPPLP